MRRFSLFDGNFVRKKYTRIPAKISKWLFHVFMKVFTATVIQVVYVVFVVREMIVLKRIVFGVECVTFLKT